ncbi:MAG: PadR family transcriptional regulator [Candidatus Cloacimonadales bacterium]|nr:PadR family transcriptional regulator [Candidatus Cloacimonadales bacterium]
MSRVDLVVLGLLAEQPMHGYKIVSFFEKRGLIFWTRVKTASVYKALQRLEKNDFISGEMKLDDNGPPKKVFTITDKGKNQFLEILRHFLFNKDVSTSPMDFWNALRFVHHTISRAEFLRALENHEKWMNEHVGNMKKKHQEAIDAGKLNNIPFYGKIMMNTMNELMKIEIKTITEMKLAAMLPENQIDFAEE